MVNKTNDSIQFKQSCKNEPSTKYQIHSANKFEFQVNNLKASRF